VVTSLLWHDNALKIRTFRWPVFIQFNNNNNILDYLPYLYGFEALPLGLANKLIT
jgi:hypothetical protein